MLHREHKEVTFPMKLAFMKLKLKLFDLLSSKYCNVSRYSTFINLFHAMVFLYPLKTSKKLWNLERLSNNIYSNFG